MMATACELCDRDPAEGGSSITDYAGVVHPFCHPEVYSGPRSLSCFEIMGYVLVENHPYGRRPPTPIPVLRQIRARQIISRLPRRK